MALLAEGWLPPPPLTCPANPISVHVCCGSAVRLLLLRPQAPQACIVIQHPAAAAAMAARLNPPAFLGLGWDGAGEAAPQPASCAASWTGRDRGHPCGVLIP